ncbi:MBL fold metallo-hydrolase [Noviherbaspirillum malthae]|uniref:MBL fold metallo-hydrolase n=1 Tax=Noviherbaspirillum malthae TaxID=1260987 RepID=UPI001890710D|nr:MBL fold metallo-hydrolase [Noviherbaspirillum malthae]
MRIHHLNCISSCPLGGKLMDGRTPTILQRGELCCHCLLIETEQGLVLVDTGFGLEDVHHPRTRLSHFFLALLSPDFREEMTALRQIQRLGFKAADVRHIVLTHLDFDHAGGLDDFPHAIVHMMQQERDDAMAQTTWLDRQRFRPQQWSSWNRWRVYRAGSTDRWFGFECVRELTGLPPEILLVPLPGHTFGHAGVAVRTSDRWLLQAGDAYFYHREMSATDPWCTPGLRLYQTLMEKDRGARLANQERLRRLRHVHGGELELVCSHDPIEFERMTGQSIRVPFAADVPARHHHAGVGAGAHAH